MKSRLFRQGIDELNESFSPSDEGQDNGETDETDVWILHYKSLQLNSFSPNTGINSS